MIQITIPGKATPKGRPRFVRRGNFVSTYTDKATESFEGKVAYLAKQAMAGQEPLRSAVCVVIFFNLNIPSSYSKKRRAACLSGDEMPTKKPDWDNLAKSVTDALNGIAYTDDAQIVQALIIKQYAEQEEIIIYVSPLKNIKTHENISYNDFGVGRDALQP